MENIFAIPAGAPHLGGYVPGGDEATFGAVGESWPPFSLDALPPCCQASCMKISIGMLLLAIYLILIGVGALTAIPLGIIPAVLAIITGIVILLGR